MVALDLGLTVDAVTRATPGNPEGIKPPHLREEVKRKDFIASARLKQSEVTSADFMGTYLATVKAGAPFMRYLCGAIG